MRNVYLVLRAHDVVAQFKNAVLIIKSDCVKREEIYERPMTTSFVMQVGRVLPIREMRKDVPSTLSYRRHKRENLFRSPLLQPNARVKAG